MKSLEREYEALQQDSDMKKSCGDSLLRNVENFTRNILLGY